MKKPKIGPTFWQTVKEHWALKKYKFAMWRLRQQYGNEWYHHPEYIFKSENHEVNDLHMEWLLDTYAAQKLRRFMPIFDKAYALLSERGHYSRKNAFGEMHPDSYLWIEKCKDRQVIVYENQSNRYLFINYPGPHYGNEGDFDDDGSFQRVHIRQLWRNGGYQENKNLKGVTLTAFREQDFKSNVDVDGPFKYGDGRDPGYIGSMKRQQVMQIDWASMRTLKVIDMMGFWEPYLDDPEMLA